MQSTGSYPNITVVINTFNQEQFIGDCLEGVISQDLINQMKILVIDDCSRIATPNKLKFPKNLYLKKLKSYQIDFRSDWKNSKHKNFPGH